MMQSNPSTETDQFQSLVRPSSLVRSPSVDLPGRGAVGAHRHMNLESD